MSISRTASLVCLLLGISGLFCVTGAQAGPLQDIPEGLADALDTDDYVAEAILSVMMLVSITLVLAMLRLPTQATIIVLIAVIAALTAMSWLDPLVILLVAILAAALFGREIISGGTTFLHKN